MSVEPTLGAVKRFWEANPVAARSVPHPLGTPEYFAYYDALREANESPAFAAEVHEYAAFAGKHVLDVGSGNGYVLSRYAMHGARTCGIDLTSTAAALCKRRFAVMRLPGEFLVGNAERLPFADASFDCVCSMGVLHHTPDTARAVSEVRRVLKPGGRLIVMFYHRNSLQYRVKFPLMRLVKGLSMQDSVNLVDGAGNPKGDVYSRAELKALLRGFADLQLFAGLLPWHKMPAAARLLPGSLRTALERRAGFFLYAKGTRPA